MAGAFRDVIAVGPQQIAWGPVCVDCPVHVLDLSAGATATIPVPRGTWTPMNSGSTFSSDGRFLALLLSAGGPPDAALTRIAVIDIGTRRLLAVPGSTLSGAAAGRLSFGWQASGHRLIAVLPMSYDYGLFINGEERPARSDASTETIQVASWQPGGAHLWVATARIPRGTSPVLGEY